MLKPASSEPNKSETSEYADATAEATNIVRNAEAEAQQFYEKRLADADKGVQVEEAGDHR